MSAVSQYFIASVQENKSLAPKKPIELYSNQYFAACTIGGILACGPTHALMTPLDLVKCRLQVKPDLYKGIVDGWKTIIRTEGMGGLLVGFGPTAVGYSMQGAGKYGLYEYFKYKYADIVGETNAHKYRGLLYLTASASAEFFADILLCPWEALKVRQQTSYPPFARGTIEGFKKLNAAEGLKGFYKGITPLWGRQIPYTMMKFASFEATVELIYKTCLSKPKHEYNKLQQLGVSFAGGYIAGVLCAAVSHPADVVVSKLNNLPEAAPGEPKTGAIQVAKELGWKGVWRGLGPRIVMIGTLNNSPSKTEDVTSNNQSKPSSSPARHQQGTNGNQQQYNPRMNRSKHPMSSQHHHPFNPGMMNIKYVLQSLSFSLISLPFLPFLHSSS